MTQEQTINDIAVKVGRLEVMQETNTMAIAQMAASVNKLVDKLEKSDDMAKEAFQRAKVSENRVKDLEDNQKWLWRTFAGAIIVAAVAFMLSGGLKP